MDRFDTSKSTGRDIQTSIFLKSLRKEMDKMASSLRKGEMIKEAFNYLEDGCDPSEVEELLIIDGFDRDLVHSYFKKTLRSSVVEGNVRWGFDIEDVYGKIVTHEDLGLEIHAFDESEALGKAEEMVKQVRNIPHYERIIGVYPLDQIE